MLTLGVTFKLALAPAVDGTLEFIGTGLLLEAMTAAPQPIPAACPADTAVDVVDESVPKGVVEATGTS